MVGNIRKREKEPVTHIMIDIETTGTKPDAEHTGIWQIGAEPIIPGTTVPSGGLVFSATINPIPFIEKGRYQEDTLCWQEKDNKENWDKAMNLPLPISSELKLLSAFNDYIIECRARYGKIAVWSKGSFDFEILEAIMDYYKLVPAWYFREKHDFRTLCNVLDMPVPKFTGAHDAYQDALNQAMHLDTILSFLTSVGAIRE
jgi:hypothetical protein